MVLEDEYRDAMKAREHAKKGLETLDETQLRILNPHTYPVGLEKNLFYRRSHLAQKLRGVEEES